VCEIFAAVVSELQLVPHVVLKSLCRHTYYIGAVCLFFLTQIRKNRCDAYKKRRPCVLSNFSIVGISVGLPVAVNNPVLASQVGFQQFRAI